MSRNPFRTFKDFMNSPVDPTRRRTITLIAAAAGLLACGPLGQIATKTARPNADQSFTIATQPANIESLDDFALHEIESWVPPEVAFLSLFTRYSPNQFLHIKDPLHRDVLSAILFEKAKLSAGGFQQLQDDAIRLGYACGIAGCGDSRVNYPKQFPNLTSPTHSLNTATGELIGVPVYRVGTQPAVFQDGIKISVFAPHQTAACITGGCGAWDGIQTLVTKPDGLELLKHHGVREATIEELTRLYNESLERGLTTFTDDDWRLLQERWSKIGARMQAEMNVKQWGGNHYTAYGIYGHADDTFKTIGVVDAFGAEYAIDDFPKLKAVTSYLNQPHPIFEEIAKGQKPIFVAANASRKYTIPGLFGNLTSESGLVFGSDVDKIGMKALTAQEARQLFAGSDYGMSVLRDQKFVALIADNARDMATLRHTLLTTGIEKGGVVDFLNRGGAFFEMIPDNNGVIREVVYVRNIDDLMGDALKIDFSGNAIFRNNLSVPAESFFLNQLENRVTRDFGLGVLSEFEASKMFNMIRFLKTPGARALGLLGRLGFQVIGDYQMIKSYVEWFTTEVLGEKIDFSIEVDYKNDSQTSPVIWNVDARVLTTEEEAHVREFNKANVTTLITGQIEKIQLFQSALIDSFAGAMRAHMKHGPGGVEGEIEPWSKIPRDDLAQVLTLDIPNSNYLQPPTRLYTSVEIKPYDDITDNIPPGFSPGQEMMLIDTVSGIPILPDIPGQKTTIAAIDPNTPDVRYLFEVSVPEGGISRFELHFVGLAYLLNMQSNKPEKKKKTTVKKALV